MILYMVVDLTICFWVLNLNFNIKPCTFFEKIMMYYSRPSYINFPIMANCEHRKCGPTRTTENRNYQCDVTFNQKLRVIVPIIIFGHLFEMLYTLIVFIWRLTLITKKRLVKQFRTPLHDHVRTVLKGSKYNNEELFVLVSISHDVPPNTFSVFFHQYNIAKNTCMNTQYNPI